MCSKLSLQQENVLMLLFQTFCLLRLQTLHTAVIRRKGLNDKIKIIFNNGKKSGLLYKMLKDKLSVMPRTLQNVRSN